MPQPFFAICDILPGFRLVNVGSPVGPLDLLEPPASYFPLEEVQVSHLRSRLVFVFGCALSLLLAASSSPAAENTVWQIGTFNQSSHEFNNRAPVGSPNYNPVFTVGKSTAKDWPARQPGSENQAEGLRPHPFTVLFDLPSKPKGTYSLTISVVLYNPRVPHLEISINGRNGTFYFPRELSSYPGDSGFESPIYSGGSKGYCLPGPGL